MSVAAMQWARGKASTAFSQLILFGIADHASPEGIAYPSQATLARVCSCGERTVREHLALLEESGLIARVRRHSMAGYRTSDYMILAPLAEDRGDMPDVEQEEIDHGRWPEAVGNLARQCDDAVQRGLLLSVHLPAHDAGRRDGRAATAGTVTSDGLPADCAEPTGAVRQAYRQDAPDLPAQRAGEQLVEPSKEHEGEPTPSSEKGVPASAVPSVNAVRGDRARTDGDDGGGQSHDSHSVVVAPSTAQAEEDSSTDQGAGNGNGNGSPGGQGVVVALVPADDGLIPPSRVLSSFVRTAIRSQGEDELAHTLGVTRSEVKELSLERLLEAVTA